MTNDEQRSLTLRVENWVARSLCSTRRVKLRWCFVILSSLGISSFVNAADWPQWRGPNRDGHSHETGLLKSWPENGPPSAFTTHGAGVGYAAPSIAGGRMFVMGDRGDDQFVICFDAKTGRELWAVRIGPTWVDPNKFHGARCTPTIEDNRLYALGAHGDLVCLRTTDGKLGWKLNILERFKGNNIKWGISESPLIEGDMLVVAPGGEQATLVALHKMSGKTVWTSHNPNRDRVEPASYASLVAANVDGQRQIVAVTHAGGYGARARDGEFLWNFKMGGASSNTTPIVFDKEVFISGAYGPGCALVNASSTSGDDRELYLNRNLRNHVGGVVLIDGYLYGCSGAFGGETLTCMNFKTGEVAWKNRSIGDASVLSADGLLYYRGAKGDMLLVEPSPEAYKPISSFRTQDRSRQPAWAHPVLAGGHLYLRDQDIIHCYDIRAARGAR